MAITAVTRYLISYDVINTKVPYAPGNAVVQLQEGYTSWADIPTIIALPRSLRPEQIRILRLVAVDAD